MKMKIVFLVHYLGHSSGDVIDMEEDLARLLVKERRARPYSKFLDKSPKDKMQRRKNVK